MSTVFPFAATVALLAGTIAMTQLTSRRIPELLAYPLEGIATEIEGWRAVDERNLDARVLKALVPTSYLSRTYGKENASLDLFVAYYSQQKAGESMHSPKHCLPGGGWEIWKHDSATIPYDGGTAVVNKYSIQNTGTRMLMYYWYQSRDRIVANEYAGKLLLARDTLLTGRTGGSIVRIVIQDIPGADVQGAAFAAKLIPEVKRCFGSVSVSPAGQRHARM